MTDIKEYTIPATCEGFACDEAPDNLRNAATLAQMGIGMRDGAFDYAFDSAIAQDEAPYATGEAGVDAPWFFLNYFSKDVIYAITQATTADAVMGGRSNGGASWAHNSITKQVRELFGRTGQYKDFADRTTPRAGRTYTRITRDIVRLSAGLVIGELEKKQSALVPGMHSPYQDKRDGISLLFNLDRDAIGYFGYQLDTAHCYGLLNDPTLAPFIEVAAETVGSTSVKTWEDKTAHGIMTDIMTAIAHVQRKLKANFIPARDKFRLVLPNGTDNFLNKVTECTMVSVREWLSKNYPKCTVEISPAFDNALGGQNVFYIIVDKIGNHPCVEHIVPASWYAVGTARRETGHSELWSMATAGAFVSQPMGIARFFGI